MYKNTEGYADPTAGEAMSLVMREYKKKQREVWKKQYELKNRPKVYVVSKYAGDVQSNVAAAITYCRFVIEKGKIPILPIPRGISLETMEPSQKRITDITLQFLICVILHAVTETIFCIW